MSFHDEVESEVARLCADDARLAVPDPPSTRSPHGYLGPHADSLLPRLQDAVDMLADAEIPTVAAHARHVQASSVAADGAPCKFDVAAGKASIHGWVLPKYPDHINPLHTQVLLRRDAVLLDLHGTRARGPVGRLMRRQALCCCNGEPGIITCDKSNCAAGTEHPMFRNWMSDTEATGWVVHEMPLDRWVVSATAKLLSDARR